MQVSSFKKYILAIIIVLCSGYSFSQNLPKSTSVQKTSKAQKKKTTAKGQLLPAPKVIRNDLSESFGIIFFDDFEAATSNWSYQNTLWQIGQPTSGPNSSYSGTNCAATNLYGNYPDDVQAGLLSRNIDLPTLPLPGYGLTLKFWHWYEIESGYDYGSVQISTDNGQSWTQLEEFSGSNDYWVLEKIDISDYAGQSIRLDFWFTSDGSNNYVGWYIDDISIEQTEIITTNNISIAIANNGQFTMGIPDGPILLYGHPDPWSSATTIQIDGVDYWNYSSELWGTMITPPITTGLQNITVWDFPNNIRLKQALTIVQGSTSGNYDTGEIRYTVTNNDATSHNIAIRIMLDTMLGLNDGAPFRVPGTGAVTTDREWFSTTMPPYYQAFDDLYNPTVQSQGTLIGGNAIKPDRFVTTCWAYIKESPWYYDIVPDRDYYWGDYGYDSAVGIYWFPVTLQPGESKDFVTYYGLGGIDIDIQPPLVVGLSAPTGLVFLNGTASGNPFSLSVYLSNSSPGVTQTAVGITTSLNLPSGLILPGGENALHNIPDMVIGAEQYTSYNIEASSNAAGSRTYSLTVTATNITTKTVQKDIYLFGINTVPLNKAVVSASLNTVTAQFNVPMNPATINITTYRIFDENNNPLNATVNYNSSENKAELTLLENLLPNRQYKARLNSSIQASDGTNLPYDVEWSFTTTTMQPKELLILDTNNNPIPNKEFEIYKVNNDLTEELKGKQTTNSEGKLSPDPQWFSTGDQVKIHKIVFTQNTQKPNHEAVDNIMYQIKIDNGNFDTDGNISYHKFTDDAQQTIVLNHTTVMYNLIVSVEWDADQAYLENLLQGYRLTSNYLYDVTDGQLFLNKIAIYDNHDNWDAADVQIFANNVRKVESTVFKHKEHFNTKLAGGIRAKDHGHTFMSRILYHNNGDKQRNLSYSIYPYKWNQKEIPGELSIIYPPSRALAHEFGHYGIGFLDEYCNYKRKNRLGKYNFGFMDNPLKNDQQSSEMSSTVHQYNDASHRITEQWVGRGDRSCWDYFEYNYQGTYKDIFTPIKIPGVSMNWGPNDGEKVENPQYDVGALLIRNSSNLIFNPSNTAFMVDVLVRDGLGIPISNSRATLYKNNRTIVIEQGRTANNGRIRVLGANNGDIVRCYARIDWDWFFSEFIVGSSGVSLFKNYFETSAIQDSGIVVLRPVVGNIRMVNEINFQTQNNIEYLISFAKPLPEIPSLELYIDSQAPTILPFYSTPEPSRYKISISELNKSGLLNILAKDDSLNNFFINQNFIIRDSLELGFSSTYYNFDGSFEMSIDSSNSSTHKLLILSSDFNPILNGLELNVEQAGAMHTIASFPEEIELNGINVLTIRYSDSDLYSKSEATLRIFKWDGSLRQWQRIGGEVDTMRNEVTAEINSFGTYAVFTTKAGSTDEKLDNNNCYFYPNPFNPDNVMGHFVFGLAKAGNITIKIYDVANRQVASLVAGSYNAGSGYEVAWEGKNLNGQIVTNGVYFYIIESSSGERAVGKVAIIR